MTAIMNILIKGIDQASQVASKVTNEFQKSGNAVNNAATRSSGSVANAWNSAKGKVAGSISTINSKIGTISPTAARAGSSIASGIQAGCNKAKAAAATASSSIKSSMASAAQGADSLTGALGEVVAGFGLVTIAQNAVNGAFEAETNQTLLMRKFGEAAGTVANNIRQIVALVPGDDTFMNQILSGAAYKGGVQNVDVLKQMANAVADYMSASTAAGKEAAEVQRDLKDYLLTGNTSGLEMSSILSGQVDLLKNKGSVEERSLALQQALTKEGYNGFATMQTTANMWETIQGGIQAATTKIGLVFLPTIRMVVEAFLKADSASNGLVSTLTVVGGAGIALVGVLGLFAKPLYNAGKAANTFRLALMGVEVANGGVFALLGSSLRTAAIAMKDLAVQALIAMGRLLGLSASETVAGAATGGMAVPMAAATGEITLFNGALAITNAQLILIIIVVVAVAAALYLLYTNWGTISAWLSSTFAPQIAWIQGAFGNLQAALSAFAGMVSGAFMGALSALWSILQSVGNFIIGTLISAWNSITTALSPITTALGNLWNAISKVLGAFAQAKGNEVNSTFAQIAAAAKVVWNALSQVGSFILTTLNPVFQVLAQVAGVIGNVLSTVGSIILSGIGAALQTIGGIITSVIGFIASFINILAELIQGNITLGQALGMIWENLKTMIWNILMSIVTGIGAWALQLVTSGVQAALGFITSVINFIKTLPTRIAVWLTITLIKIALWVNKTRAQAINAGRNFILGVINFIKTLPAKMWVWLVSTATKIVLWAAKTRTQAKTAGKNIILGVINYIKTLPSKIWTWLVTAAGRITSFGSTALSRAKTAGQNIYNGIKNKITSIPGMVYDELMRVKDKIYQVGQDLYNAAVKVGEGIYNGVKSAMHINSPGIVYYMVAGEFDRINAMMEETKGILGKQSQGIGNSIVDNFNPSLSGSSSNSGSGSASSSSSTLDLNLTIVHDLKNVPADMDENKLIAILKTWVKDPKTIKDIVKGLSKEKAWIKSNLG